MEEKEEEDIAALIYQDCMRRRAEAAAAATVQFSTRRTSSRLKKELNAAPMRKRKSTIDSDNAGDLAPKQKRLIKKDKLC